MSWGDGRERMSDDARYALSLAAMSHERRNRPTTLVVLAAIVVVVMGLFAAYSVQGHRSARAELRREVADHAAVERMGAEWARMDAQVAQAGDARLGAPIPDLFSRMERLALDAGLARPQRPGHTTDVRERDGIVVNQYTYSVRHETLTPLLNWVRLAEASELGLEVTQVRLEPGTNDWQMTVRFRRWERLGS